MIRATFLPDVVVSVQCERRRFQRLHVGVQTELRVHGSGMPIRLETTDLSLGGCYVQMAITLAAGTPLDIVLWLGSEKVAITGTVVTCHPQFGNGIEFNNMTQDSRQKLQAFLERNSATTEDEQTGD
jgi:c-di-GMP-binding flagellar brake protein YcgR